MHTNGATAETSTNAAAATTRTYRIFTTTDFDNDTSPKDAGRRDPSATKAKATPAVDSSAIKIILKGSLDLFSISAECREFESFKSAGHHPNIFGYYEVQEDEWFICLVLELLEGSETLMCVTQIFLYLSN